MSDRVEVAFGAKLNDLKKGAAQVKAEIRDIGKVAKEQKSAIAGMNASMKSFLATAVGIGTISAMFKKAADQYDRIGKLSTQTGMSVEFLQKLGHTADLAGTNLESAAKAANKFAKEIHFATETSAVAEAISSLNLNIAELRTMSPETLFETVGIAVANIENPTKRAAVAMALFGRSGTELLPTLEAMRDGLEINGALTHEQIKNIEHLNDAWTRLNQRVTAGFGTIYAEARPVLDFIGKSIDTIGSMIGQVIANAERLMGALGRSAQLLKKGDVAGAARSFSKDARESMQIARDTFAAEQDRIWNAPAPTPASGGGGGGSFEEDAAGFGGGGGKGSGVAKDENNLTPEEKAYRDFVKVGMKDGRLSDPGRARTLERRAIQSRERADRANRRVGGPARQNPNNRTLTAQTQAYDNRLYTREITPKQDDPFAASNSATGLAQDRGFFKDDPNKRAEREQMIKESMEQLKQQTQEAGNATSPGVASAGESELTTIKKDLAELKEIAKERLPEGTI